jgi:hypothetical protein
VVFELHCRRCLRRFFVCRPDYRGQGYCSTDCCELEQAALHRVANARHQRSNEGRQDHAAHQRASAERKHAERQPLTGEGREKVALGAECLAPEDPFSLMTSDSASDGRTDADDIHGGCDPVGGAAATSAACELGMDGCEDEATGPAVSRHVTLPGAHFLCGPPRITAELREFRALGTVGWPNTQRSRFYAALWIGVLLVAGGAAVDAFPDDLDELAAQFFTRFKLTGYCSAYCTSAWAASFRGSVSLSDVRSCTRCVTSTSTAPTSTSGA